MIDSVVLQLAGNQFRLLEHNRFNEARTRQGRAYSVKSKFSAEYAKSWAKKGIYCPRFELFTKKEGLGEARDTLEMQFSISKLLYGTNLFDADVYDGEPVRQKLLPFLNDLGVETSGEKLKEGILKRVDFSKIIKLPDYLGEADEIVRLIQQFNYKPQSQYRYREYSNGKYGIVSKFWNKTQGYAIYDKFAEILNEGYTQKELEIQGLYYKGRFKRNALKFELSLQRKDALEAVVRRRLKSGKKKNFYLDEILNKELSHGILLDAFNEVFDGVAMGLITLSQMEDNLLYEYLAASNLSQFKQEKLYFWVRLATKFGIAGTWERLKVRYKGGSVGRLKKDIALILQELGKITGNVPNLIGFLRSEHEKFEINKPRN